MRKIKVMTVFGTRPEAIKMAPVVKELQSRGEIEQITCVTAQHRQMLDQVLETFKITPEYDLDIMEQGQTLNEVVQRVLGKMGQVLEQERPDIVLVHGDTTTTFAGALAAFHSQIAIGHVEAGLRTWNKYSPYPEEMNRQMVGCLADMHFAPTRVSAGNLIREGKDESKIYITGNTAIDAMSTTVDSTYRNPIFDWIGEDRMILLTAHRRENLGEPMYHIFRAIKRIVDEFNDAFLKLYEDNNDGKDLKVGDMTGFVRTEYGIHVIIYTGECKNLFDAIDGSFELNADAVQTLYNTRVNILVDKTYFDVMYDLIYQDNYQYFENANLNFLRENYNIYEYSGRYADLLG